MLTEKIKWRLTTLGRMLARGYPEMRWSDFLCHLFPVFRKPAMTPYELAELVGEEGGIERFRTSWGEFRVPHPGREVLSWLLQEVFIDCEYEHRKIIVGDGDVVVDCGAHVGVFARFALFRGASRVVCLEVEPANVACLRRNLCMALDRVHIFEVALWSRPCQVELIKGQYSDCHRVELRDDRPRAIHARTLDEILGEIQLDRVDFIKMDVEGAEPEVLTGSMETVARFHPKLAIATYHDPAEEEAIRQILRECPIQYTFYYRHLARTAPYILFAEEAGNSRRICQ